VSFHSCLRRAALSSTAWANTRSETEALPIHPYLLTLDGIDLQQVAQAVKAQTVREPFGIEHQRAAKASQYFAQVVKLLLAMLT
jgi:hypothetical protein